MLQILKNINRSLRRELNVYHTLIGFITSLVVLHVNFLLSLRNEYALFSFVEVLICLVYPITLLFFSIGQSSRSYLKLKTAKLIAISSLITIFLIFYCTFFLIVHDIFRFLLVTLSGSLFFFSIGRLSTQLRDGFELKVTKFIYLGKFFGIIFTFLAISYLGYNLLVFIALILSLIIFYGVRKKIIIILSAAFIFQLYYRQPIETYLTEHTFSNERITGLTTAKKSGYSLQNSAIKTFWSLKGFSVLNKMDNNIHWWIHNFSTVFRNYAKEGDHEERVKIYSQTTPADKVLIIGIGGGMSLRFIPFISKNIYSVDYDCLGLREFSKINTDLNNTTIKCTDASKIAGHYPSTKFQYIYMETALTQNNQAQSPFFSDFNMLTLEALRSYKNMLDIDKGIFIFEVNHFGLRRKAAFGATLSNLLRIYGKNNCKIIFDKTKYVKNLYVLCSHKTETVQQFLPEAIELDKSNFSTDLNLNDNFPFLFINQFLITTIGPHYYIYFLFLSFAIFLFLISKINKRENLSRLYWSEFFSNVQFYSIIVFVGGFLFDTSFSFLFISSLNLLTIFIILNLKKTGLMLNKKFSFFYVLLLAVFFYIVRDYSLPVIPKNILIIGSLFLVFIMNAFIFKTNITESFYKFKNLNKVLYIFYSLSAAIAFTITLLIGIFPTLLLSSAGYLWVNVRNKAD